MLRSRRPPPGPAARRRTCSAPARGRDRPHVDRGRLEAEQHDRDAQDDRERVLVFAPGASTAARPPGHRQHERDHHHVRGDSGQVRAEAAADPMRKQFVVSTLPYAPVPLAHAAGGREQGRARQRRARRRRPARGGAIAASRSRCRNARPRRPRRGTTPAGRSARAAARRARSRPPSTPNCVRVSVASTIARDRHRISPRGGGRHRPDDRQHVQTKMRIGRRLGEQHHRRTTQGTKIVIAATK